jgi:hypothetical protein
MICVGKFTFTHQSNIIWSKGVNGRRASITNTAPTRHWRFAKYSPISICHCLLIDPTQIILTKSDKIKKGAASNTLLKVKRIIEPYPYVSVQLFSSLKKQGLKDLSARLDTFFAYVD